MLVHVDTESWQSEINLITLLSETKKDLKETEKLSILKSATTRLYDTEAKIICIVSKKGAQCIEW